MPTATALMQAADLIRHIKENKPVRTKFKNLIVEGDLDLEDLTYDHKLLLNDCIFKGHFLVSDANFTKSIDLSGCLFEGDASFAGAYIDHLVCKGASFKASFDVSEVRFDQTLDLRDCNFAGAMNFAGAKIDGSLWLNGATIAGGATEGNVDFELAEIRGNLLAHGLQSDRPFDLSNVRILGKAAFSPLDERRSIFKQGLWLGGAKIEGLLDLDGTDIRNTLFMMETQVGGTVFANGMHIKPGEGPNGEPVGGDCIWNGVSSRAQIQIDSATFEGRLNMAMVEAHGGLFLQNCRLHRDLAMPGAKITKIAVFDNTCVRQGLDLTLSVVEGKMLANGLRVGQPLPTAEEATAEADSEAEIEVLPQNEIEEIPPPPPDAPGNAAPVPQLEESSGPPLHPETGEPIVDPVLGGSLLLVGVKVSDRLELHNISINGDLNLENAEIRGSILGNFMAIDGTMHLFGAKIGGSALFYHGRIRDRLDLANVDLHGNFHYASTSADFAAVIGSTAWLSGAKIGGALDLPGTHIGGDLVLTSASIKERLFCEPSKDYPLPTRLGGALRLNDASICGGVYFTRATLHGELDLRGASVAGGLHLAEVTVEGNACLSGAAITGRVNLSNAHLHGELMLEGIRTSGDVHLEGAAAQGKLSLKDATVGGDLCCRHVRVENTENDPGTLLFAGVRVSGELDLVGASTAGDLNLDRAAITGRLRCSLKEEPLTKIGGALHLGGCSVYHADFDSARREHDAVAAPKGDWEVGCSLDLKGFAFQELELPDNNNYLKFLERSEPFQQSNYVQMEKWLKNRGEEEKATRVYLAMRDRLANLRRVRMTTFERISSRLSNTFVWLALRTYGVQVVYLLLVVALSIYLFLDPASVVAKGPGGEPVNVHPDPAKNEWTIVDAFWMSIQINLPIVPINQVDQWQPSREPLAPLTWELPGIGALTEKAPWVSRWLTYQNYSKTLSWITSLVVLPLLGGSILTRVSRRRAVEAA